MKRTAGFAVAAAICVAGFVTASAKVMAASPTTAVRKTLESYRAAIVGKDGKAAVALVGKASLAYYASIAKAAVSADKATLAKRPMVDRLTVLRLRQELPAKTLRRMSGAQVFEYIVDQGWNERLTRGKSEIKSIAVDGDEATAEVLAGRMGAMTWKLTKEDKTWRVDVRSMLPAAERMLVLFHKRSRQSEDAFVLAALKLVTGKDAPASLWNPPK